MPFVMHFKVHESAYPEMKKLKEFVLVGTHIRPARVYGEINGLAHLAVENMKDYGVENALILGDLNADQPYFSAYDKQQCIPYQNRELYKWLISERTATNVKGTKTYDQ